MSFPLIPFAPDIARLHEALEKLKCLGLPEARADKIENLLKESRFKGIYTEYFLASDFRQFRQSLPSNQLFLQQARELGLDEAVLEAGIADEGLELRLQERPEDLVGELSQKAILLYAQGFARKIQEHITLFQNILAQRRLKAFAEAEGEFFEVSESTLVQRYLGEKGAKAYRKRFDRQQALLQEVSSKIANETRADAEKVIRGALPEILGKLFPLYQRYEATGKMTPEQLRENGFDIQQPRFTRKLRDTMINAGERLINFGYIYDHQEHEHSTFPTAAFYKFIREQLPEFKTAVSISRLQGVPQAAYFLRLEELPPEDVTFGNDGASCIAVYADSLDKGTDVPFYQLDLATLIFGIYQKVNGREARRVGIIPSFAAKNERGHPVLAINSLELSQAENPLADGELQRLVAHSTAYVWRFCRAAGFLQLAMGRGDFNTGMNFLDRECLEEPDYGHEELVKLPDLDLAWEDMNIGPFYSQLFKRHGTSIKGAWVYVRTDRIPNG